MLWDRNVRPRAQAAAGELCSNLTTPLVGNREIRSLGLSAKSMVCVLSSRLGRKSPPRDVWLRHLKSVVARCSNSDTRILTAPRTTCDAYLRNASFDNAEQPLVVHAPPAQVSLARWRQRFSRLASDGQVWVSPCLEPTVQVPAGELAECAGGGAPLRDRLLLSLADIVYVLHVRQRGNLDRLLALAAGCGELRNKQLYVSLDSSLVPEEVAMRCIEAGAYGWSNLACRETKGGAASGVLRELTSAPRAPIVAMPTDREFLFHWTRSRMVPLAGETISHYLNHLEVESQQESMTPLPTLFDILRSNCLLASSWLNRSQTPVVCFTQRSLEDFSQLRRYRPHLRRWDFEPYGVAIAKETLRRLGARPVFYATEDDWQRMPLQDRPWFQPQHDQSGKTDWSIESEWRLVGDLDFGSLPKHDVFVFVRTHAEAARVAQQFPWSVVVASQ